MSNLTPRTVDGGFTVIDSVRLSNKTEIVMGRRESFYGINYATWKCSDGNNYYWGHYDISTEQQARECARFSRNSIPSLKLNQKILTKTNVKCDIIIAVRFYRAAYM